MSCFERTKPAAILLALLTLVAIAVAQDQGSLSDMKCPRPYFYGGPDLQGNRRDVLG